jgi:hypothetical protein
MSTPRDDISVNVRIRSLLEPDHVLTCDVLKDDTAREFKLRPEQKVLFAQTVGYPA